MIINDRVYGEINITEPVLLEIINSKPLQRLKGINQAGASVYVLDKDVTRYEHSLGVMILLKKLGATVEEQIVGLMHDIPHTAFSHVIDFVFKTKDHDFHERFHEKIVMASEIPEILKRYGYDIDRILDEHNFKLLERDIPDLCADRVDYTLRDLVSYKKCDKLAKKLFNHLIVQDNEIVFDNQEIAKEFAEVYIKMDEDVWSHPLEVALFQILADALKIALDNNIIIQDDLFMEDDYVYEKLKNSDNPDIQLKIKMLNPNIKVIEDPANYDFHSRNKLRFVDPKVNGKRVSEIYPEFKKVIQDHKEKIEKGNYIKIIEY